MSLVFGTPAHCPFLPELVEELGEQKDFGELIDICESGGRAV
tara:strand:+ start:1316 stop:1441 length:126 start_codon:yes stop_codon:yes gene_type:complete